MQNIKIRFELHKELKTLKKKMDVASISDVISVLFHSYNDNKNTLHESSDSGVQDMDIEREEDGNVELTQPCGITYDMIMRKSETCTYVTGLRPGALNWVIKSLTNEVTGFCFCWSCYMNTYHILMMLLY